MGYSFCIVTNGTRPQSEFTQRLGKSLHCCGFTGCTAQPPSARKIHEPSSRSFNASPRRSTRSRRCCSINFSSLMPTWLAIAAISAASNRTSPGQRQQAVQRWHSTVISMRKKSWNADNNLVGKIRWVNIQNFDVPISKIVPKLDCKFAGDMSLHASPRSIAFNKIRKSGWRGSNFTKTF